MTERWAMEEVLENLKSFPCNELDSYYFEDAAKEKAEI